MYAMVIEVNVDDSDVDAARDALPKSVVPMVRDAGATAGYWLAPQNGRGLAVVVFDTEDEARSVAAGVEVGKPALPDASAGATVKAAWAQPVVAFDLGDSVGQDARRARDVDVVGS